VGDLNSMTSRSLDQILTELAPVLEDVRKRYGEDKQLKDALARYEDAVLLWWVGRAKKPGKTLQTIADARSPSAQYRLLTQAGKHQFAIEFTGSLQGKSPVLF
jgi:ABC-type proline/glycine betaine transport system substrate-binding protein